MYYPRIDETVTFRRLKNGLPAYVVHKSGYTRAKKTLERRIRLLESMLTDEEQTVLSAIWQDKELTERVARAAELFDIRLLDHIIIAREGDFSFRREGLMGR